MSSTQTHRHDKSIIRFPHLIKRNLEIFSNNKFKGNLTSIKRVIPRRQTDVTNLIVDYNF